MTRRGGVDADALVGRVAELDRLRGAMETLRGGTGSSWLITGEPGIGKTRLMQELAAAAEARGLYVRWGRCWEDGGAPVFWPWVEVLRDGVPEADLQRLGRSLGDDAAHLARIVPAVSESPHADTALESVQLFEAICRALAVLAEGGPGLVVVIDDLHAADHPSVKALAFIASRLNAMPVMVCATYRRPELAAREELADSVTRLHRGSMQVSLKGLDREATGRLVDSVTDHTLDAEQIDQIHLRSDGNPLFARSAARALADGAVDAGAADATPQRRFESLVRDRLTMLLPPDAVDMLHVAAVLGRDFDVPLLARVTGRGRPDLLASIGECLRTQVLATLPDDPFVYRFTHALVRNVLYGALDPGARLETHRRVALALEDRHRDAEPDDVAAIAHHLYAAGPLTDVARGVQYHVRAAEHAMHVAAHDDALAYVRRALALHEAADHPEPGQRAALLVKLGNVQNRAGMVEDAKRSFSAAAELARRAGDSHLLAEAAVGYGREGFSSGTVDPTLTALLEEALPGLEEDDAVWIDVATRLAIELYYAPGAAARLRRISLADQAVARAERLDDPHMLSYAVEASNLATAGPDNVADRLAAGTRIKELADRVDRREGRQSGHVWRTAALLELGDIAGFEEELSAYDALASSLKQPAHLWYVAMLRASAALLTGPVDRAVSLADEAREIGVGARSEEVDNYHVMQCWTAGWLRADVAELAELEPRLHELARSQPSLPAITAALGCTYLLLDRPVDARRELEGITSRGIDELPRNLGWLALLALLAELGCALGDTALAEKLLILLDPYDGRTVVLDWSMTVLGPVEHYRGLLACTLGDDDAARSHLEAALAQHARLGSSPWETRTRRLLARVGAPESGGDGSVRDSDEGTFRDDGDFWTVALGEESAALRRVRGLEFLALMLQAPGREFHVLDLVAAVEGHGAGGGRMVGRDELATDIGLGDAGSVLDGAAKSAYRQRLADLREDLQEAEAHNDFERASTAREEMDFLARELASAVGLGGRDKKAKSAAERARVSVTKAIRKALKRIASEAPELGDHLGATVKTGYYCSYSPDPRAPIRWRTGPSA